MTTTEKIMSRRFDEYARSFDVTDTLVVAVDAEPDAVGEALARVDLRTWAVGALSALGMADRVALGPALLAAEPGKQLVFGLVWRNAFGAPGHVNLVWDVRAKPGVLDGTLLSTTVRFAASDEETRARLLDAWGIVGVVAKSLVRRTLAAVRADAEERDEAHQPPSGLTLRSSSAFASRKTRSFSARTVSSTGTMCVSSHATSAFESSTSSRRTSSSAAVS